MKREKKYNYKEERTKDERRFNLICLKRRKIEGK